MSFSARSESASTCARTPKFNILRSKRHTLQVGHKGLLDGHERCAHLRSLVGRRCSVTGVKQAGGTGATAVEPRDRTAGGTITLFGDARRLLKSDVQARVLEVEVPLDGVHDVVVDLPLASELDDRPSLGVEKLAT